MASAHSTTTDTDYVDTQFLRRSPLHLAAFWGNFTKVKRCLSAGDDVDSLCCECVVEGKYRGSHAWSPLYCSAGQGHAKVVKFLLKAGANPSYVNPADGTSVLYVAALNGNAQVITMLIKAGAVVNWTDHKNRTALFGAAWLGRDKVIEALLSANAAVDIAHRAGNTSLMIAALGGHERCVRLLLQAGADFLKIDNVGNTALHCGAQGGSADVVRALLSGGAHVDSKSRGGLSSLHIAADCGNGDVIKELLRWCADIEGTDREGRTALHHSAICGCDRAGEALPSARAPTTANHKGGHLGVVDTLLGMGASVDSADVLGKTALFAAAGCGHFNVIKLLIDAGADPHVRDLNNATALMHAVDLPTVKALLEAGVAVAAVDVDGNTVLHRAGMWAGDTAMICAVFKAGANPTLLNKAGQNATQAAREEGHDDAAMLLDILATKYTQAKDSDIAAKDMPATAVPSEGVTELDVIVEAACIGSKDSNRVDVGLAERSQDIEKETKQRVLRPCLNCQTLTHRRGARCRTAFMCSHDCQLAMLAEHRVTSMEIHEGREGARVEQKMCVKVALLGLFLCACWWIWQCRPWSFLSYAQNIGY